MPAAVRSKKTAVKHQGNILFSPVICQMYRPPFAVCGSEIGRGRILTLCYHFYLAPHYTFVIKCRDLLFGQSAQITVRLQRRFGAFTGGNDDLFFRRVGDITGRKEARYSSLTEGIYRHFTGRVQFN